MSDVNLKLYEIVCCAYDVGVTPNPTDRPTFLQLRYKDGETSWPSEFKFKTKLREDTNVILDESLKVSSKKKRFTP